MPKMFMGTEMVEVEGMLVERDALRIAEAIQDYDENLVLLCLDPAKDHELSEEPFIVAEKCPDGILRPVLRAWQLDDMILMRIKSADCQRVNPLDTIEQITQRIKKENQRRYEEWRAEAKDIAVHVAGMKSSYTVRDSRTGDLLTFYDDRPPKRS